MRISRVGISDWRDSVGQRLLYVQKLSSSAQYISLFSVVIAFGILGPGGGGTCCAFGEILIDTHGFLFLPVCPANLKLLVLNCINGEASHCTVFSSLLLGSDIPSTRLKPFVYVLSFIFEKPLFCKYISHLFMCLINFSVLKHVM